MIKFKNHILLLIFLSFTFSGLAQTTEPDSTKLPFPFKDNDRTNPFGKKSSPLYGNPPSNIEEKVEYDPETNTYKVTKKIGNLDYSFPETMSVDEYRNHEFNNSLKNYWGDRWKGDTYSKNSFLDRSWSIGGEAFETIFGANTVEIHPQGSAELIFGLKISRVENPTLPERLRSTTTFDFQEKIQMNVTGKIGDALSLGINYDTEATFDFENKMKLAYEGKEDDIIQKIEAGDVTLPLSGSLISGSQSLFGFKTELKFGKLTVTSVFSQQKGKRSEIEVEGGSQVEEFEVYAAEYEANKHFFLSQYFYKNYDDFLEKTNIIRSPIQITKVEVWVTNKTGNFNEIRNVVAFMDLGEGDPNDIHSESSTSASNLLSYAWPSDESNKLKTMKDNLDDWTNLNSVLSTNYDASVDYEKVESARMLRPNEFKFNRQLGYLSLNSRLSPDEVLAVAFEYTANGKTYRVGEFANNAKPHPAPLVLKLLKGTSVSPKLPRWDLMMKNIYALGAYQLDRENFELHVLYKNDKTGTAMNYIDAGDLKEEILLNAMRLDQLNSQNNQVPGGDGAFDFLENITINQAKGRIIFPVVEPFGSHLRKLIGNTSIADKYAYDVLYSETQNIAKQEARKNKFMLKGKYQASSGSEISLNALNVPQGSVTVSAGGRTLFEGSDFTVDYTLGRVKILNQGLLESGTPIKISLESHSLFSMQTKTMLGTHLDYKFNEKLNIGATLLNLSEKPLTQKVTQGDEPINNTIWGVNGTYQTDVPLLTKMVDAIPFIDTKETSSVTISGEFAQLIPGHSSAIGEEGHSYIDDFEGSTTKLDQKYFSAWHIASLPRDSVLFPSNIDGNDTNSTGVNRAKLAWYTIDPVLVRKQSETPSHLSGSDDQKKFFVKEIYEKDLWPKKESANGIPTTISALNLAYYPKEKGPYNYDVNVNNDGSLASPEERWGGIQREISSTDFEESNIEYIEFWMMDPFVYGKGKGQSGDLIFNIGDISEDILRDSRKSFEEGLPVSADIKNVDTTAWGRVSTQQSIVFAFDNDPDSRSFQDVGYDGLGDAEERTYFQSYLDALPASLTPTALAKLTNDPSSDNYHYYRGSDYDSRELDILKRYKNYNGAEGNSPTSEQSTESYPTSASMNPNNEDINRDYTLNEAENYYQYQVKLFEGMNVDNHKYIVDKVVDASGIEGEVDWYQFRIPVKQYDSKIGQIYDFKSIRFMRMLLKNFSDSVILRFATLDLVRGQWRKYTDGLREPGAYFPSGGGNTEFEISAVNIEENGHKEPVNYVLPPEVSRVIDPTNPQLRELNEQAMVYKVTDLSDGDARAAYKSTGLDIRQYKRLQMFVHAEQIENTILSDNDISAFIRLGSDYTDNYYEYEIPLKLTEEGVYTDSDNDRKAVWPTSNMFDFPFSELTDAKMKRNSAGFANTQEYIVRNGNKRITIKGNPTISDVRTIMIGVRNPKQANNKLPDDGISKDAEVWFNELRLAEFDEEGGWAANMRVAANLADFANVSLSGSTTRAGFGSIEKKVSERSQDDIYGFDIATNFSLGKFFPEKTGITIPMYLGYSKGVITPKYNPLSPDLTMEESIANMTDKAEIERLEEIAKDQTTRKSINFTNVKVKKGKKKAKIYSISNWSATYSYNTIEKTNVTTELDNEIQHRGILSYNFSPKASSIQPFKKAKSRFLRSPAMRLIKDFNFSLLPKQVSFMTDMDKRYHEKKARLLTTDDIKIKTTYDKDWRWNRKYDLRWDLTKNLKLTFNAMNTARIDEPDGIIDKNDADYQSKRDTIMEEIMSWGTTKQYRHSFNLNYTLPINKISFLNWVSSTARYGGDYYWDAGPKVTNPEEDLGNVIRNSRNLQLTGQANLKSLYDKVGYFKKLDKKYNKRNRRKKTKEKVKVYFPLQKEPAKTIHLKADQVKNINHKLGTADVKIEVKDSTGKKVVGKLVVLSKNKISFVTEKSHRNATIRVTGEIDKKDPLIQKIAEHTVLALLGVKNISVSYTTNDQTVLPGYRPRTTLMGMQDNSRFNMAPGLPFIFGQQDRLSDLDRINLDGTGGGNSFLERAEDNDWLTTNPYQTNPYTLVHDENISVRANIKPIKGLRIDLTTSYRYMQDYTVYYTYNDTLGHFEHPSKSKQGSYSISINTLSTAFESTGDDYSSDAFDKFKSNRSAISQNIGRFRAQNDSDYDGVNGEFADGYSELSQDVLIHSFFTAYTGKDPNKVETSSHFHDFLSMFPGWRATYDGLGKTQLMKRWFRSITFNHGYQSTYNIGNYSSNSDFTADHFSTGGYDFTNFRDINTNYTSEYDIQSVNISEQFSPLFGIDMTLKNSLNFKVEFKRSRNLTLNISNVQITEVKTQEYIVGSGYRFKKVPIRFNKTRTFESDLNIRMDFSIRDNLTIIRKVIDDAYQITSGQNIFTLKFNADYNLTQSFNVRFFFDWITNNPKVSNRFKTTNINFGLSVRFSLS